MTVQWSSSYGKVQTIEIKTYKPERKGRSIPGEYIFLYFQVKNRSLRTNAIPAHATKEADIALITTVVCGNKNYHNKMST